VVFVAAVYSYLVCVVYVVVNAASAAAAGGFYKKFT